MVSDNKILYVFSLAFILFFTSPVWAGSSEKDVTVKEIKQETQDVIQTLEAYTEDQQQEALKTAEQAMQRADRQINRLENRVDNRWDELSKPARQETREALRELRQERVQLAEWYGSMKQSSQQAWSEMKTGFNKAYESMADAWQDAQQEFDKGRQDA